MDDCQVLLKADAFLRRIETINVEKFVRPVGENTRRVQNPAAHVCKPLSLCEVELRLFAFFNLEVNPDPIQQSSIARPERFCATEEPAVPSFRVANSKTQLTGTARAQTC